MGGSPAWWWNFSAPELRVFEVYKSTGFCEVLEREGLSSREIDDWGNFQRVGVFDCFDGLKGLFKEFVHS